MNYIYYEKKNQPILAYSPQPHMNTIQTTVSNPFHFLSLDRSSQSRILTGSCSKHKGLPVQSGCSEIVTGSIFHYRRHPTRASSTTQGGSSERSSDTRQQHNRPQTFLPFFSLSSPHSPKNPLSAFFLSLFFFFTSTPAAVW